MYKQFIVKLESGKSDILDQESKDNLILSSTVNIPLTGLGFHSYIHRTKSSMSMTDKLQTKNKFYMIVNPYEPIIQNYEDSINTLSKTYFNSKEDKPEYISTEFYELWEILFLFNLANTKDLSSAVISNDTDNLIESLSNFRNKFIYTSSVITSNKSLIYDVTDNEEQKGGNNLTESSIVEDLDVELIDTTNIIGGAKSVGSKKKKPVVKKGGNNTKTKINLATFNKSNLDLDLIIATTYTTNETVFLYYEQENYKYIISRMISVLNNQVKGGSFILKIHESFTKPTIKLIYLLSSFYEEVNVYKPLFSRPIDSSKYLICSKFKGDNKAVLSKKIKSLELVLNGINANRNKFVFDIYPDLEVPSDFLDKFKFINIRIANQEQIMINDIIVYIKGNNYFGESYHKYRNTQIESIKWWVTNFYPPSKNLYDSNREELTKAIKLNMEKYEMEASKLKSLIIS